jgi:hypothetical protein
MGMVPKAYQWPSTHLQNTTNGTMPLSWSEPSPGFRKVYLMTLTEQTEMDTFLEKALATGRIRQSKSPLGAPVFFIKKKDGKLCFVQDYQALNAITRKNQYPLPLINDLIHWIKGTHYFTKLDVCWGYNTIMSASMKAMSGRLHSALIGAHLNPYSCTLASPIIVWPHSR